MTEDEWREKVRQLKKERDAWREMAEALHDGLWNLEERRSTKESKRRIDFAFSLLDDIYEVKREAS